MKPAPVDYHAAGSLEEALWQRRTRILELADEHIAARGESAVLY